MLDPSQFNIDRTYPVRWTITFSNPPINMFVPSTIFHGDRQCMPNRQCAFQTGRFWKRGLPCYHNRQLSSFRAVRA